MLAQTWDVSWKELAAEVYTRIISTFAQLVQQEAAAHRVLFILTHPTHVGCRALLQPL